MSWTYLIGAFCFGVIVGWSISQLLMRQLLAQRLADLRQALSEDERGGTVPGTVPGTFSSPPPT